MTIRLLLVDDHAVVRSGLRMLLGNEEDLEIIGEAGSGREALDAIAQQQPDLVLMDIGLPDNLKRRQTKKAFPYPYQNMLSRFLKTTENRYAL